MTTQREIADRLGLDVSTVNKILKRRQGSVFRAETVRRVFRLAEKLGYDLGRFDFTRHRRRCPRVDSEIPATVTLLGMFRGHRQGGTGTILDLSTRGARIGRLELGGSIPTARFGVVIVPLAGGLKGIELHARVIRMAFSRTGLELGLEFTGLDRRAGALLLRCLDSVRP